MASTGKKGKKSKGKTLALTDFLADETTGAGPTLPPPRKTTNWADDVENTEEDTFEISQRDKLLLPTAPKAARGPDIDDERIPKNPPYLAYISNLPYDIDEDDISYFFKELKIVKVRLPRDDRRDAGRLKGFGYVEFEDRSNLVDALSMSDQTIKNRRIRVDVADSSENERRRGGGGRDSRERSDGTDRTMGDWRSAPRSDLPPSDDRDRGGYDRGSRSGRRDFGGGFRDGDRERFSSDRDRFNDRERFSSDRDRFSSDRDRFSSDRDRFSDRPRFGGDRDRFGDRDSFGDRDRYPEKERFSDRDHFGDRDRGSERRERDFVRSSGRDRSHEDSSLDKDQPKERPRLQLQPRTKPLEETPEGPAPASIFGGAKPVDTAARERQIEERLAREKETIDAPKLPSRDKVDDYPVRSKGGDSDKEGKEADSTTKEESRVQSAPPPRENVWTRRAERQQTTKEGTHEEGTQRHSDSDKSDSEVGRRQSPSQGQRDRNPPGQRYQQRGTADGSARGQDGVKRGDIRSERGGRGPPPRGGSTSQRGRPHTEGGQDRERRRERPADQVDVSRMPKFEEKQAPNFAASNKFAYLPDEDDPE